MRPFAASNRHRHRFRLSLYTWKYMLCSVSPRTHVRAGGDVVRLSRILGHSHISTTMRSVHLLTEDLQRPHQGLSILNRLR